MTNDDTIPLRLAATLRPFTFERLKEEGMAGKLVIYKVGGRYYTKLRNIDEWVESCRVEPKVRDFTSIRRARNSSSETVRASSALAAANETAQKLKNSSRNTLGRNIALNRQTRQ